MKNNEISELIKLCRKKAALSQVDLSDQCGVGLRFIRELESGKKTVQMDKVNQVLNFFGYELTASKIKQNSL